jgi:hypothetical protein
MKAFMFHMLLCLLLATPVPAQFLRADAEEKSFGEMRPQDRRTLAFTLYNIATDTIHLGEPKPSCGCTATMLDRSVLGPGDSARISVEFHAAPGMTGSLGKSVSIYGNVKGHSAVSPQRLMVLRVRAEIATDVKHEPGTLRFSAVAGDTVTLEILLRSNSSRPVRLGGVTPAITAYVDTTEGNTYRVDRVQAREFTDLAFELKSDMLEPGDSTRLIVTLYPREKGQINGSVNVALPDAVLRIPLIGAVLRQRE